jgi:hypothetical protein
LPQSFSEKDILEELARQERRRNSGQSTIVDDILSGSEDEEDQSHVDIIEYIRADWGLNDNPYPVQRFILKVIFGIALDDRPDDLIVEVLSLTEFTCFRPKQFRRVKYVDIGDNKACKIKKVRRVGRLNYIVELEDTPPVPIASGDWITGRIEVWDRFRENILGLYNEREFFDFLHGDGPGSGNCRISVSRDQFEANLGRQMNLVLLRIGRRGTKTSISQWIAAFFCYKVLKKYHPQEYYQTRLDQAITITLIATTKNQAQDLLGPARASIKRSPYLSRYVTHDDQRRIELNTPYNMEHGLDSESGIKVKADPCSAKATRGPATILGLLEEFGLFMSHIKDSNSSDKEIFGAIAPSISDLTNPDTDEPEGLLMIISTPLTTDSYMHEIENNIWEGNKWDEGGDLSNMLVVHMPSYWTNPLLSTKILRGIYSVDPIQFDQEYDANYSDQFRKQFVKSQIESCRLDPANHEWLISGEDTFMGFDLGGLRKGQDRTTISIVAMNANGFARLVFHEVIGYDLPGYEDYLDELTPDALDIKKIAKQVDDMWIKWSVRKGMGDEWNMFGIRSHLTSSARDGLELVHMTKPKNDQIARNFIAYVEQRRFTLYYLEEEWKNDQSLLRELTRLEREETGGSIKTIALRAPRLQSDLNHDDQYSSFSRALFVGQDEITKQPPIAGGGIRGIPTTAISVRERAEMARSHREVAVRTQRPTGAAGRGFRR